VIFGQDGRAGTRNQMGVGLGRIIRFTNVGAARFPSMRAVVGEC